MEQVGFFGPIDKKDLLLNIGRILTEFGKKVLIIDGTYLQRLRYIVPKIGEGQSVTYISEYCGVDVAVGFMNARGIMQYLGTNDLPYDYIFIDTDNIQTFNSYGLAFMKKLFFVTSYDRYEVGKAKEVFSFFQQPITMKRVIISSDTSKEQQEALNREYDEIPNIKFENQDIVFADTNQDREFTLENQLTKSISYKHYTNGYKDDLEYITATIAEGNVDQTFIKRIIKQS